MTAMKLEAASLTPPPGLEALLADLGGGENGFGGTPVHGGEMSLAAYLERCVEMTDPAKLQPGFVPQTVYWVLDDTGEAVGMVRLRHHLNPALRDRGGHIGYYVRSDRRGRGLGREILRQALDELRKLGEPRALLTVDIDNLASVRVIEANGGRLESVGVGTDGAEFGRYWIELD